MIIHFLAADTESFESFVYPSTQLVEYLISGFNPLIYVQGRWWTENVECMFDYAVGYCLGCDITYSSEHCKPCQVVHHRENVFTFEPCC